MADIHSILRTNWGYTSFRPMQEDIIRSVLSGKDTLAIMPTGGGKSICFQVPALASKGICLVITPLIALMKDQVQSLKEKGMLALSIHSGMPFAEVKKTLDNALYGNYKFLYVSPERLETDFFKDYLPALPINLIAVDEAHCISQWGYDFRPAYLHIAAIRGAKPGVPVLALTASATKTVQEDICEKLLFREKQVFQQSYERPNLSYSVFNTDVKMNKLLRIIQKVPGSGIVYCRSRKRTKAIAELLQLHHISADYYHAGLLHDDRNEKQENWLKNKTRIMVCTNAFGMGIDKPDVRAVVHADIPDCLESYYQEAGRAGRDGKKSYAVLLYTNQDMEDLQKQPDIRFPSFEDIKHVYQCIVNYLQLPAGSGRDIFFDFDMEEFTRLFKLNMLSATYAIKALEQEGIIEYNEQLFVPSTVVFCCGKETLQQVEKDHPMLTPCIKYLLRSYGGIFDIAVPVSEKQIAKELGKNGREVEKNLLQLRSMGLIQYEPRKDSPQLRFLSNRVITDNLRINTAGYQKRKRVFVQQTEAIIGYAKNTLDCHAQIIARYFNDHTARPCGICDNCIQKKKTRLSANAFSLLQSDITSALMQEPLTINQLMEHLRITDKEKIWKVIEHLLGEGHIEMSDAGYGGKLSIKKKGQDRNPARF
ncbi:MAG TPA: ATP-dependent DNA helicase RecQ [Agriterribacter sp.]|nr:ATP-dependent DNA helicase RecQ [Agriterribacter sp.]